MPAPVYRPDALPRTERLNAQLIRLPAFPSAGRPLLEQYGRAFAKVLAHASEIRGRCVQAGAC
jgi:hypothetical protein